jgi:hypothetical protein
MREACAPTRFGRQKSRKQRMPAATEYAPRMFSLHRERAAQDDVAPARRPMAGARFDRRERRESTASAFHPFARTLNRSRLSA